MASLSVSIPDRNKILPVPHKFFLSPVHSLLKIFRQVESNVNSLYINRLIMSNGLFMGAELIDTDVAERVKEARYNWAEILGFKMGRGSCNRLCEF